MRSLLSAVREGNVQLDDEVAVAWGVQRPAGRVASLDESRERHLDELALRRGLREAGPERRALGRVLADGERVQEEEAPRIRERSERLGRALVLTDRATSEQRWVAAEEIELRIDGHRHCWHRYYTSVVLQTSEDEGGRRSARLRTSDVWTRRRRVRGYEDEGRSRSSGMRTRTPRAREAG